MIKKIGVLGAGTMGHGIALAFAMYGYDVNVYEPDEKRRSLAKQDMRHEMEILAEEGIIDGANLQKILDSIKMYAELEKAVIDRDYVIEAIPEILELKQDTFKKLDELCPKQTIFSSNTSSLRLSDMMDKVSEERKKRMMVTHWYNPAHIIPLVELSFFGNMPEEIYKEVESLYKSIRKQVVKVLKDVPGLVANRIQQAIAREVFALMEMGVAAPEDIDRALTFGPAFRFATSGLLQIADFGGLDIWCIVADNLWKVLSNATSAPEFLKEKVKEGKLGLKTGEGFFSYKNVDSYQIKKHYIKKLIHQLKASQYYF